LIGWVTFRGPTRDSYQQDQPSAHETGEVFSQEEFMKHKALFIAGLLLATAALAAGTTANLSWSFPTEYTDGSSLAVADIQETVIQWRRPNSETVVGSLRVTAPTAAAVATVVCNNYTFTAKIVMKDAAESGETGRAAYATGIKCVPNPPSGLTVN
jgi:hypothetical protein